MFKNFCRVQVACKIFLTSDFFHKCVVARIMEKLLRLSCVRGYHVYQDVQDASYWRMDVLNIRSVNIS